MPKPYPKEFRDDVVRVARNREPGQQLKQIAADFGISESCLTNWLKRADVEDGHVPAVMSEQNADLRDAKRRIRLLEQENEVLNRPGVSGGSVPWEGWSHVREYIEEVSGRAA
ncbi:transposase [Janibacter indicus]|uniref:transposase n=1 Tax=Janibacter indicus TaxID=857417 RepID=UPI001CF32D3B|nr:transposase [Janibacter indicus]